MQLGFQDRLIHSLHLNHFSRLRMAADDLQQSGIDAKKLRQHFNDGRVGLAGFRRGADLNP